MFSPELIEKYWARIAKGEPHECWEWRSYKLPVLESDAEYGKHLAAMVTAKDTPNYRRVLADNEKYLAQEVARHVAARTAELKRNMHFMHTYTVESPNCIEMHLQERVKLLEEELEVREAHALSLSLPCADLVAHIERLKLRGTDAQLDAALSRVCAALAQQGEG